MRSWVWHPCVHLLAAPSWKKVTLCTAKFDETSAMQIHSCINPPPQPSYLQQNCRFDPRRLCRRSTRYLPTGHHRKIFSNRTLSRVALCCADLQQSRQEKRDHVLRLTLRINVFTQHFCLLLIRLSDRRVNIHNSDKNISFLIFSYFPFPWVELGIKRAPPRGLVFASGFNFTNTLSFGVVLKRWASPNEDFFAVLFFGLETRLTIN